MSKPPDHPKMRKKRAQLKGRWAERLTRLYLIACGYTIVAANYKTKVGEVDIIAKKGAILSCIEVKARPTVACAAQAVSARQQRRIQRATEHFLAHRPHLQSLDVRFDVALVTGILSVTMLRDAWRPTK